MIYQPSLFAHINSIDTMHSNRKFWKTVTVKQLSSGQDIWIQFRWCWQWLGLQGKQLWIACHLHLYALFPLFIANRHQNYAQYVPVLTDYTHKFDTHRRYKELLEQNGFSVSQPLVLCLRNAFDMTIRQTIKRYYRLQQLELRFALQMEWCITHHIRAQYIETTLQCTEMKYSICSDAK